MPVVRDAIAIEKKLRALVRACRPLLRRIEEIRPGPHRAVDFERLAGELGIERDDLARLHHALDQAEPFPIAFAVRHSPGLPGAPRHAIYSLGHHDSALFAALAIAEIHQANGHAQKACLGAVRLLPSDVGHEMWGFSDEPEPVPVTVLHLSETASAQAAAALERLWAIRAGTAVP